ncbi:MAG: O-antigen ligase family protein [Candidatus Zixiibacteriota bacterium]
MTSLAAAVQSHRNLRVPFYVLGALLVTAILCLVGLSFNTGIALVFSISILILYAANKGAGLIAGIIFYLVKAVFVRIAYAFDLHYHTLGNLELLGMAPTLVLSALIVGNLYLAYSSGQKIAPDRTRQYLLFFAGLSFLSIFLPTNSVTIGLGGFQRNLLPNMLIMFLACSVWREYASRQLLVKTLLLLGIFSCLYGIGQWFEGLYAWEKGWMLDVALGRGDTGWMTIGLRGIEFRIFSIFYSYMDFFFTNVAIFALAYAHKGKLDGWWRFTRVLYFIVWGVMLLLSVERMPMLMTLAVIAVAGLLRKTKETRRILARRYVIIGVSCYLALFSIAPILAGTGAETFRRLAELANPFAASSIQDRTNSNWGPALEVIGSHPWGVGIGYGSQTRASDEAQATDNYVKPHNELLQKLLETGVIGGILFLMILGALFRSAIRQEDGSNGVHPLAAALAGLSVAFWLCGIVNLPFSGASGLIYWALAGFVLADADRRAEEEEACPNA